MSDFIESFYYGNIEAQSLTTELTPKLRKKLNELVKKEEDLASRLPEGERELFMLQIKLAKQKMGHISYIKIELQTS